MLILHIVFNYFAVRAVCLKTLNEPRFIQLIDTYLKKEIVASPCEINKREPIIFYQLGPMLLDLKICGFKIILGRSMTQTLKHSMKEVHLKKIKEIYRDKKYILFPNTSNRNMYIFFKDGSETDDILCAYFHAVLLSIIICAINDCQLPVFHNSNDVKSFAQVCKMLQSADWSRIPGKGSDFSYEPSYELLSYVHKIATKEWNNMRVFLIRTGWDLSKHLLMVDEWRVCDENLIPKETSLDNTEHMYTPDSISFDDFEENFNENEIELLTDFFQRT
ncbi:unnamed protein product [Euphydryas editha]|nr:unnamed protein product [Euphydryas editha]